MTKAKISEYDASAGNNTDVNNVNIAEGCAPSGINNAIREVMAALKRFETGADGDSLTVGGSFVVSGGTTLGAVTATSVSLSTDLAVADGGTGSSTAAGARTNLSAVGYTTTTGSVIITSGSEAQRDGSPSAGYFRFNTDSASFEGYDGTAWGAVGGGNSTDTGLWENSNTISANYTITTNNNAMSAGPISVASGVVVTVPSGSRWVIV